jgi:ribosome-binding ATPase YchF (GTP1/OBG family)
MPPCHLDDPTDRAPKCRRTLGSMKDVGIVGMPYAGKSTLFAALTRSGAMGGRAHQAVVDGGLTTQGIAQYRQADALCIVVRAFGPEADPKGDLAEVEAELLLADLASIESGLDRAKKRARASAEGRAELDALQRAHAVLDSDRPLVAGQLDDFARKLLKGYGALTLKPWIVVANTDEGATGSPVPDALPISAALEAEVAGIPEDEVAELLAGFGIEEPGLKQVVGACYRALDLVTFLTTGEDETRAWEVPRGAKAPQAAGAVHSDLERGFIRAEVVSYDELVQAGSWDAAKAAGHLRVEGRDYVVAEVDVMNIRFAS